MLVRFRTDFWDNQGSAHTGPWGKGNPVFIKAAMLVVVLVGAVIGVPGALGTSNKSTLACGDTVFADVLLTKSLKNCSTGLIVGADNITIDLDGHTIEGLGPDMGTGVEATGRTGITVEGGSISSFATGVHFQDAVTSTIQDVTVQRTVEGIVVAGRSFEGDSYSAHILDNKVTDSVTGITLLGDVPSLVAGNNLIGVSSMGIFCNQTIAAAVRIESNRSSRNQTGIRLFFCQADLVDNDASHNLDTGISRTRSNGLVEGNTASDNGGYGILADDSPGELRGNATSRNGATGLAIVDQVAEQGPFHTVANNEAKGNGWLGISATTFNGVLQGVVDGGGNRARRNGDPLQCTGVACS